MYSDKLLILLLYQSFLYLVWYTTMSILGHYNNFFFAAHLLDIAMGFKTLRTILSSVTHNGKQVRRMWRVQGLILSSRGHCRVSGGWNVTDACLFPSVQPQASFLMPADELIFLATWLILVSSLLSALPNKDNVFYLIWPQGGSTDTSCIVTLFVMFYKLRYKSKDTKTFVTCNTFSIRINK